MLSSSTRLLAWEGIPRGYGQKLKAWMKSDETPKPTSNPYPAPKDVDQHHSVDPPPSDQILAWVGEGLCSPE